MTDKEKELLASLGYTEADTKPSEEDVTINDLVEAIDILTNIVLGGE